TKKNGWTLTIIGNGSLKNKLIAKYGKEPDIFFKDFLQPNDLVKEMDNAGVFCLPSNYEPWGVVIQEFAAAGLPIIASNACGAASVFVKINYNGLLFKNGHLGNLQEKLEILFKKNIKELQEWSINSHLLSNCLKVEMYSSNFFQFIKN
ncbi:MAG: glycosyltransferase, partial [Bacteroidota bacterium]